MTAVKHIVTTLATGVLVSWMPLQGLAQASSYFVAPGGSDGGSGSQGDPFATIEHALDLVGPGDTVFVADGTYDMSSTLRIENSGTADSLISLFAEHPQMAVLDFDGVPDRGIDIRGSYLHLRGLIVENAGDNGIYVKRASNNTIEYMTARYNGDSGVQVEDGSSNNLILNTDSYGNYDPQNHGENADGFAIKFEIGEGNVLRGCRAFDNSDDGFDFWEANAGVTVEDSWSFNNGHNLWEDSNFGGDSNGFKLGHGSGAHLLIRNLAWGHMANGFDVNGNTTGVTLYNNTAFNNGSRNFFFDENNSAHVLRNNVSVGGDVVMYEAVDDSVNSWNGLNVGGVDFESLNDAGSDGPRGTDGSLPQLAFLHPAAGSAIIDAGMDVGLDFKGAAPDLGAFEYGDIATATTDWSVPETSPGLTAYPNPFHSELKIEFETGSIWTEKVIRLSLYDVLGRLVKRQEVEVEPLGSGGGHGFVVLRCGAGGQCENLTSGTYFLVAENARSRQATSITYLGR